MTAREKLLLGCGLGGLLALIAHPISRSLLFYPFLGSNPKEALQKEPICSVPAPIPEPKHIVDMTELEIYRNATLISRNCLSRNAQTISDRDCEIALRFLTEAEKYDPDNAVWPQIAAAISYHAGRYKDVRSFLYRAAQKTSWRNGSEILVQAIWHNLSRDAGIRLSWQGLLALSYRPEDIPKLFATLKKLTKSRASLFSTLRDSNANPLKQSETFDSPPLPNPEGDSESNAWLKMNSPIEKDMDFVLRLYLLFNAGLIRDFARSIESGKIAIDVASDVTGARVAPPGELRPTAMETLRTQFIAHAHRVMGDEIGNRTRREFRSNTAWYAILRSSNEIAVEQRRVFLLSLFAPIIPSSVFFAGITVTLLGLLGYIFVHLWGKFPHPDNRVILAIAILGAVAVWACSSSWLLGAWCLLVGGITAYPMQTSKPGIVPIKGHSRLMLNLIGILSFVLLVIWFSSLNPSLVLAQKQSPFLARMLSDSSMWGQLAFVILSLVIPITTAWAHLQKKPVLAYIGKAFANIGFLLSIISLVAILIFTPLAIYIDSRLQPIVESWILNEPQAFRIIQP
ncbi:MAG TPA: hypothetical protein VNK96_08825 [Fimbriimonadales bacterium]|nr:hypothetical protein [Fimbriimonadales bacterium]